MREITTKDSNAISEKWRTFSGNFIPFSKSPQNFPHFETKDELHRLNILEVIDADKCSYFNAPKLLF